MPASLAPLLALAGHCFAADFSPGTVDRHCFSAVYGGHHVRDVHAVTKGDHTLYAGESLYSIDGGTVAFTYWSTIGGIGRGTATFAPGDWTFNLAMRASPTAASQSVATHWRWHGADTYVVSGGPAPVTYRRSPGP